MRTLLIGATGQLGQELRQVYADYDLIALTHADLDVTDAKQSEAVLDRYAPELILNTAAYHRVDECEEFPAKAYEVNALAVRNLGQWAKAHQKVRQVVETDAYGLYHITNNGACSWYEFAGAIFEMAGVHPELQETTSAAFGARATRPAYSVLDNANLRALGLDDLRHWRDALKGYLADRPRIRLSN